MIQESQECEPKIGIEEVNQKQDKKMKDQQVDTTSLTPRFDGTNASQYPRTPHDDFETFRLQSELVKVKPAALSKQQFSFEGIDEVKKAQLYGKKNYGPGKHPYLR